MHQTSSGRRACLTYRNRRSGNGAAGRYHVIDDDDPAASNTGGRAKGPLDIHVSLLEPQAYLRLCIACPAQRGRHHRPPERPAGPAGDLHRLIRATLGLPGRMQR